MNAKPCISQTPGRVQYYRAENEPYLPGKLIVSDSGVFRRDQVENLNAREDRC